MRAALIAVVLIGLAVPAMAQNRSRSYGYGGGYGTGSNPSSTYVAPSYNSSSGSYTSGHYRTTPNNTQYDNFGTRGNANPYTGQMGTRSPRW